MSAVTFEAVPLDPGTTWLVTETIVEATDDAARRRFQHYRLMVGLGILGIRLLVLPAIRREAERRCPAVGGRRAHVHSP